MHGHILTRTTATQTIAPDCRQFLLQTVDQYCIVVDEEPSLSPKRYWRDVIGSLDMVNIITPKYQCQVCVYSLETQGCEYC